MKQKGFILIVSLIFLVLMTILGISMFGGFTQDEMMSGNHREKVRSIEAAQTALNSSEYWMIQPGNTYDGDWIGPYNTNCTTTSATPVVCPNALATPTTLPWAVGTPYTPAGMSTAGGPNTYAAAPNYYIQFLGTTGTNPPTAMYQVTAAAQGGNATATAVVQAVYQVTAASRDIGGG
jgi:type IV pilus assembly protein PilX